MDDCPRIRELLSEHIDGALDEEAGDLVDQHLLVCAACREELASMGSLVEELRSLEPVQAPEDFLDQLHERMAPRFTLRRVLRAMFVPPRIKIPLELATALTAAIMVFSIFTIQHSKTEIADLHDVDGVGKGAEELGGVETFIELALVLRQKDGVAQELGSVGEITPSGSPKAKGKIVRKMPMTEGEKRNASRAPSAALSSETAAGDRAVSHIRSLIALAGGRWISSEQDPGGGLPTTLVAAIPSKNYAGFLDGLASMGQFVSPTPIPDPEKEELLRVRIRVLPPTDRD